MDIGGPRRKRARSESGKDVPNWNRWLGAHSAKKFPYKEYGREIYKRGTPAGLAKWGASARAATPTQLAARRAAGIIGSGDYVDDIRHFFGNKLCDDVNNGFRSLVKPAFGRIGKMIGGGMYTGHGDYQTQSMSRNSLIKGGSSGLFGPHMSDVKITHREYITDIFGPAPGVAFNVQAYNLNPALGSTFPFLSQIAANFDEYEFNQMIWTYKSTTTDIGNSTTGQCGTVIQCVNYNAAAPPFQDKGIMMEYFGAVACKVTESSQCGVECDPKQNAGSAILYTRPNPVVTGQDLKTYDLGIFQLAVANSPAAYANLPIGELWVDYTVTLRKPKLFVTRGLEIDKDSFYISNLNTSAGYLTASNWFGAAGNVKYLLAQQNNIGCQILPGVQTSYTGTTTPVQTQASGSGLSLVIPAAYNGNLRITINIFGTVMTSGYLANPTFLGNIVQISDIYASAGGEPSNVYNSVSAGTNIYILDIYVKQAFAINYTAGAVTPYTGGNNVVSFSGLSVGALPVSASISIEQYQPLGGLNGMTTASNLVQWVSTAGTPVVPL